MNIFIDTNILLSFYHYTSDDLEELKKLTVLLQNGRVRLFVPEQIIQEFRRNRENKIADALKKLRAQKLNLQFPQFCKGYDEYENLRKLQRTYSKVHGELVKKVIEDIQIQNLKADTVIQELIEHGTIISIDNEILEKARTRMEIGNPPGKSGSLGDAINWEALLFAVPDGEGIYFIADDNDFASPINSSNFSVFLREEWFEKKSSSVIFYRSLTEFFKGYFPDISLASELEKEILINELANSSSFSETHSIIAKLKWYSDFTVSQVNSIVAAAISNNQVYWIMEDLDVRKFLLNVIKGKEELIDPQNLSELYEHIYEVEQEPEDIIPF